MIFDSKSLSAEAFYHLMIQAIIPRPIAWVLSENPSGNFNIAPFSFFNGITSEPPIIMISVGWKDEKTRKDTWVNIEERNKFVVHIPPLDMAKSMVETSAALALNDSEADYAKLKTTTVEGEALPRIVGPKVAFYCRKYKIIEVGEEQQGLIMGQIEKIWAEDTVVSKKGNRFLMDPKKINPVSRLGGKEYSALSDVFSIDRPRM